VQLVYLEISELDFNQYLFLFGGITGIIAGFCFISVVEFGFLLYRLLLTFCTNESVSLDTKELQETDEEVAVNIMPVFPQQVTEKQVKYTRGGKVQITKQ